MNGMEIVTNSSSSISTNSSVSSEKHNMKQFILAVQEYNTTRSEEVASLLSRYLQLLAATLDLNTFDPRKSIVSEFFVSLHELMNNLDSRSNLMWSGVTVLQQACQNPDAHKALINVYQFLPILSKLLGDHLSREKKKKILNLMQELTYGIKITWQTSHLDRLVSTLTRWIQNKEEPITSLSLSVLLNLCYKNLPVIYILMRTVKTTEFFKMLMTMNNSDVDIQVLKLLIILQHINRDYPKVDMCKFVRTTFITIVDAFNSKDVIKLRHVVEFFLDVQEQNDARRAIATYDTYGEDTTKILDAIEGRSAENCNRMTDMECMSLMFEFLYYLIKQNIPEIQQMHPRIINLTLSWVQTEMICTKALGLLKIIALSENSSTVLEPLSTGLPVFLYIIDNQEMQLSTQNEQCKKFAALLQLLRALVKSDMIRPKVLATLKQDSICKILNCLSVADESLNARESVSEDIIELHVHTLALLYSLSVHEKSWLQLYMNFLGQKKIQASLSQAFLINSVDIKHLIFEMARSQEFPSLDISKIICDLQMSIDFGTGSLPISQQSTESMCYPIVSHVQNEQLDHALCKLKNAIATNQISTVATSEVMELYEYKLTAMGHAERAAQASLEASNQHATHLQHRLAQMTTELTRLHQLLFHSQQSTEENQKELKLSQETNQKLTNSLKGIELKLKDLESQYVGLKDISEMRSNQIIELQNTLQETYQSKKVLHKKYEAQIEKNKSLLKAASALEESLEIFKKEIAEKCAINATNRTRIEKLEMEVHELNVLREQHEKTISCKERELCDAQQELTERKKILDAIMKLTNTGSHE